jgi:hypothetical protein
VTYDQPCEILAVVRRAASRASLDLSHSTEEEILIANQLIIGHSVVEVPGNLNGTGDAMPDSIVLPEAMTPIDFVTVPCKHEVGRIEKTRQAKQGFVL